MHPQANASPVPPWLPAFDSVAWQQAWLPQPLLDPLEPYLSATCAQPIHVWISPSKRLSHFYLQLLQSWQQHPLSEFTSCLQVRRFPTLDLDCELAGARQRQHCDLPLLPNEASARHIVFRGSYIASADPQLLMLPERADVSLLAHEIAHWLGLVDEYAMSPTLAQAYCAGRYKGPSLNVIVTDKQVMSALELEMLWAELPWRDAVPNWQALGVLRSDGRWRLGSLNSQQIGLHSINTCAHAEGYAWRPVGYFTAMQYHDTNRWPELYLELIRTAQQGTALYEDD